MKEFRAYGFAIAGREQLAVPQKHVAARFADNRLLIRILRIFRCCRTTQVQNGRVQIDAPFGIVDAHLDVRAVIGAALGDGVQDFRR